MNIVLWILQILLAIVMLMVGTMKVMWGKEKLVEEPRVA